MRVFVLLIALIALGGVLRLVGNDLLPLRVEPDPHCAIQVGLIERGVSDPMRVPDWGKYPHLVAWTTVALTNPAVEPDADAPLAEHLVAATDTIWRTRMIVGLLGLLAVPATWLLARRVTGEGAALFAAALMATSLLGCHFGAQARPHGAAVAFSTLTLWAWSRVAARGTWGDYAIGSMCGALAVGSLQSGLALGFPVLAAHLASSRRRGGQPLLLGGKQAVRLLVPLLFLAVSVALLSPFLLPGRGDGGAEFGLQEDKVVQAGHPVYIHLLYGGGFEAMAEWLLSWEPALALGLVLALGSTFLGRKQASAAGGGGGLVMWSYAVPYLVVNGLYERTFERFLLPLVPVFAVVTAWGLARLVGRWPRRSVAVALGALLIVPPTFVALRLVHLRLQPTTQELAAEWLEANGEMGVDRVLVTLGIQLPNWSSLESQVEAGLRKPSQSVRRPIDWDQYQVRRFEGPPTQEYGWNLVPYPLGTLTRRRLLELVERPDFFTRRMRGRFVVAEQFTQGRVHASLGELYQSLRKRAEDGVVARFSPDPEGTGTGHPLAYQDETRIGKVVGPVMFWRILHAERMGPTIEILGRVRPARQ